jgi:outer membrane protein assembly factor BamB
VTGVVWAIDLETGKKLWSRDLWKDFPATKLQRGFAATAMVESNQLILPVGGAGSGVVALELGTGRTKWASTGFPASYTSPVVGTLQGQRQIVVLMEDALIGLAPSTGMLLWQTPFQTPNSVHVASPIIVRDRHVLVGSSGGTRLVEVSKRESGWTAETVWRTSRCAPQIGNYITLNDQAIAPSSGGSGSFTTSLNLKDGSVAWKERFGGRGSLFRLRDGILTLNDSGDLEIRRVSSSATIEVFRFSNFAANPQWGAPAFARNIMVLQTGDLLKAWKLGTDRAVRR